jgi:hypothetical protein
MLSIKKKIIVMALLVSASGFLGKAAFSAEEPTASVRLGLAVPLVGDLKDIADTGLAIGAQMMHVVSPQDKYGIDVSYISFGKDSEEQVDTEVSIISTLALMHHNMSATRGTTPFIETGFGFARTQVNIAPSNVGGAPITRGDNEEDISPTFLLGVGFDMPISNNALFGVSVDYQHFFFKVGAVDGGGSLNILAHLRI